MGWLRLACGWAGLAIGMIGGNTVWLRHCSRTKKSFMDWVDGPWSRHWNDLSHRERRKLLAFFAVFLFSFMIFFVWLKP
jgi:hypothetical protein